MRYLAVATTFLAASVGFAVGETTEYTSPTAAASVPTQTTVACPAQSILDACLKSMKPQLANCAATDYKCLCEQSYNVLTCYNNCLEDTARPAAEQWESTYCSQASAANLLNSSTSSSTATATSVPTTSASTTSTAATGTSTAFGDAGSKGAANGLSVEAGKVIAVAAAAAGAVLGVGIVL